MQEQSTPPAEGQAAPPAGNPGVGTVESGVGAGKFLRMAEQHGPSVVGVILLMAFAWILAGWARTASRRALARTKFDPTLGKVFSNAVRWVILLLAGLTSLNFFGITATSFAAVVGAVTLAIGLGFQNSLSNLAAGVMLLILRPFKVGDIVTIAGQTGEVNEVDLLLTEIDTFDGRRVFLPNNQVFGNIVENITHHPRRRVEVPIGVHYDADIDQTRAALEAALLTIHPRLDDPPPEVALTGLGPSSVDWVLKVWAKRDEFGATREATIRAAKYGLDRAGIPIPYPQMDVHLKMSGGATDRAVRITPPETTADPVR